MNKEWVLAMKAEQEKAIEKSVSELKSLISELPCYTDGVKEKLYGIVDGWRGNYRASAHDLLLEMITSAKPHMDIFGFAHDHDIYSMCNFISNPGNLEQYLDSGPVEFDGDIIITDPCYIVKHDDKDEVLDEGLPLHPLAEQRESVRDWRQVGLGIFGLADCLIQMGITYGSDEAIDLCNQIGFAIANEAIYSSAMLAKKYGSYPKYKAEAVQWSEFYLENTTIETRAAVNEFGVRNSQLLTIAPTGTLSTMLRVSGGIEPIFANSYTRKTESLHGHDEYYKVYTPIVERYMKQHSLQDEAELPEFFVTAQTLNYMNRIKMQAIWQDHIDASISSTVNVPNDFTTDEVENLYLEAWRHGLKGITMFRDGCKRAGILTMDKPKESEENKAPSEPKRGEVVKAGNDCVGLKRTLYTGCGTLHCEAFFNPKTGDILETYFSKGSSGGCNNFMIGLSRMISLAARGGVSLDAIVDQLKSSGTCPSYAVRTATKHDTSKGSCCPVAIGNALVEMHKEFMDKYVISDTEHFTQTAAEDIEQHDTDKAKCPQCGSELVFEGGCNTCKNCGWSKCE